MYVVGYKVRLEGMLPKEFIEKIRRISDFLEGGLDEIGNFAKRYMQDTIVQRTHRHPATGTLMQSITAVKVWLERTSVLMGVGDISKMNKEAPYWELANFGGFLPPPVRGYFEEGSFGTARFRPDKRYKLMIPRQLARPLNYIEITANWLGNYFPAYWRKKVALAK